jgi:hypothetical protein
MLTEFLRPGRATRDTAALIVISHRERRLLLPGVDLQLLDQTTDLDDA